MHCAERRRRNWFSPWSGTLNHKAANSAALGQTLGRNSGLLPPAPVVKTQHNAQEWTVSIDVIFKANPAGPTCCSPGPPYRTPEISLLTLWNQTRAFSSGLSFQNQIQKNKHWGPTVSGKVSRNFAESQHLWGKYHYRPIFKKRIEVEKDKRSYSSLHRFQGQIASVWTPGLCDDWMRSQDSSLPGVRTQASGEVRPKAGRHTTSHPPWEVLEASKRGFFNSVTIVLLARRKTLTGFTFSDLFLASLLYGALAGDCHTHEKSLGVFLWQGNPLQVAHPFQSYLGWVSTVCSVSRLAMASSESILVPCRCL